MQLLLDSQETSAVVITVASHQRGPGFNPLDRCLPVGEFACSPHVGFVSGSPASSPVQKHAVRLKMVHL